VEKGIQFQNDFISPENSTNAFFFFYLHLSRFTLVARGENLFVSVYVSICDHAYPPFYRNVRSPRKFQFPQDKLHFTANLFPALGRRKPAGLHYAPFFFVLQILALNRILRDGNDASEK
jgi:hypothetical protein